MTLAGEIDQRRSPLSRPETRIEAANILATVVNRFSTDEPMRFGRSQVRNYSDYSDVVRNAGQYNAWMGAHVPTTQRNYDANKDFWDSAVRDFFSGELQPSAPNATHYHADFISPSWSRSIDRVAQAGPHIFYNDERYMGRPIGEHRPSYPMAAPTIARQRPGLPNPMADFNRQELAAIAPRLPATPQQMQAAKARPPVPSAGPPLAERSLGATRSGITLGPNTQPLETLSSGAREMVRHVQERSGLPRITINHGYRSDADHRRLQAAGLRPASGSQHRTGNALDFSVAGLSSNDAARMLDAAIYGGAREIGASPITSTTGLLHAGLPRDPAAPGNGYRSWGYPRDGRDAAPWVNESSNYRDLQRGRQYFRQGTPTPRDTALSRSPQSTFPSRPSTPSGLSGAPRTPQRAETTPRLSEMSSHQSDKPAAPVFAPINKSPSSFPARPSMGQGGLPAAQISPADAMRAQADAIQRETARPGVPTARISRPALPPQRAPQITSRFPARPTAPPQLPRTPSRAPVTPPQIPANVMAQQYGMRALESAPSLPQVPQVPNPVPSPVVPPTVPDPVARPSTLPQFGTVPNPMARPGHFGPNVGPIASPRPRTRARQVPNPMAAPQRPGGLLQAFSGFNDWAGGMIGGVNNALNQFAGPAAQQRFASQPTRYAGGLVLPPQPTSTRPKSSGGSGKSSSFPSGGNSKKSGGSGYSRGYNKGNGSRSYGSKSNKSKSGVGGYFGGGGGFTW